MNFLEFIIYVCWFDVTFTDSQCVAGLFFKRF